MKRRSRFLALVGAGSLILAFGCRQGPTTSPVETVAEAPEGPETRQFNLAKVEVLWPDGRVDTNLMGEHPYGVLITVGKAESGTYSLHVLRDPFPVQRTPGVLLLNATREEQLEAALGYMGEYGTYRTDEGTGKEICHVLASPWPNLVGRDIVSQVAGTITGFVETAGPLDAGDGTEVFVRRTWKVAQ